MKSDKNDMHTTLAYRLGVVAATFATIGALVITATAVSSYLRPGISFAGLCWIIVALLWGQVLYLVTRRNYERYKKKSPTKMSECEDSEGSWPPAPTKPTDNQR